MCRFKDNKEVLVNNCIGCVFGLSNGEKKSVDDDESGTLQTARPRVVELNGNKQLSTVHEALLRSNLRR